MSHIIVTIFERVIQYAFVGVIIALSIMLILLISLHTRNNVTAFLRIQPLRKKFEQMCELSDRLDENHIAKNPYGSAMWLTRLICMGIAFATGLMVLWIMVIILRG